MAAILSVAYLKWTAFPIMDSQVSVRSFWRQHRAPIANACADYRIKRSALFGLNYYAERAIPLCSHNNPPRIEQKGSVLSIVE